MNILIQDELDLKYYDFENPSIDIEEIAFSGILFSDECCYATVDAIIEDNSIIRIGFCFLYESDEEKLFIEDLYGDVQCTGIAKLAKVPKTMAISAFIKEPKRSFRDSTSQFNLWCSVRSIDKDNPTDYIKFRFRESQFIMISELLDNILNNKHIEYSIFDEFRFLDAYEYKINRLSHLMPKDFFIGINDIYFLPKTLTEKIFDKNNNECVISYNLEFKSNLGRRYTSIGLISNFNLNAKDKKAVYRSSRKLITNDLLNIIGNGYLLIHSIPATYRYDINKNNVEEIYLITKNTSRTSENDIIIIILEKEQYLELVDNIIIKIAGN